MSLRGKRNSDGSIKWSEILAAAAVIAGYTFISSLIAAGVVTLFREPGITIVSAALAALFSFFGYLMTKLGLTEKKPLVE
jgi:ABC-type multidrug transport system permease subunit